MSSERQRCGGARRGRTCVPLLLLLLLTSPLLPFTWFDQRCYRSRRRLEDSVSRRFGVQLSGLVKMQRREVSHLWLLVLSVVSVSVSGFPTDLKGPPARDRNTTAAEVNGSPASTEITGSSVHSEGNNCKLHVI